MQPSVILEGSVSEFFSIAAFFSIVVLECEHASHSYHIIVASCIYRGLECQLIFLIFLYEGVLIIVAHICPCSLLFFMFLTIYFSLPCVFS